MEKNGEKFEETQLERRQVPQSSSGNDVELPTPLSAWLVLASACLYYCTTLCGVTASSSTAHILKALKGSTAGFFRANIIASIGGQAQALWLADSYLIIVVVVGPSISRLGDVWGRRYLSLFGALCGFLGCMTVAISTSIGGAIAGVSIFGIAFAMLGNTCAIAIEVVSRHHRGTANSIMEFHACLGVVLALFPGAAMVENQGSYPGWRSLFWFIGGLFALSGLITGLLYFPIPPQNPGKLSMVKRLSKIDPIGTCLLGLSLTPFLLGLIWGGETYSWKSAAVLVPLIGGIVMMFMLAIHQYWFEKDGVFAHPMFQSRNYPIALYGCFVEGMVYLVVNAYFGEESGAIFESRIMLLATRYSAFPFAISFGVPFYSLYVYHTKRVKGVLYVGYLFMLAGAIGFACVKNSQTGSNVSIASVCLAGFGFAGPQVFLTTIVQLAVPPDYVGLATAMTHSARFTGGSVAIAASGAIYRSKIKTKLPAQVGRAALAAGLTPSSLPAFIAALSGQETAAAKAVPGVTDAILAAGVHAAKDAQASSFKFVWVFVIPWIIVGLGGAYFLHPVGKSMNGVVDRPTFAVQAELEKEAAAGQGRHLSDRDEQI